MHFGWKIEKKSFLSNCGWKINKKTCRSQKWNLQKNNFTPMCLKPTIIHHLSIFTPLSLSLSVDQCGPSGRKSWGLKIYSFIVPGISTSLRFLHIFLPFVSLVAQPHPPTPTHTHPPKKKVLGEPRSCNRHRSQTVLTVQLVKMRSGAGV